MLCSWKAHVTSLLHALFRVFFVKNFTTFTRKIVYAIVYLYRNNQTIFTVYQGKQAYGRKKRSEEVQGYINRDSGDSGKMGKVFFYYYPKERRIRPSEFAARHKGIVENVADLEHSILMDRIMEKRKTVKTVSGY